MIEIYVITPGTRNRLIAYQFAFHDQEEAQKFRDYIDRNIGASGNRSTIHKLYVYDSAMQLIGNKND